MFGKPRNNMETRRLDFAIDRVLDEMDNYGPDSEEYPKLLTSLERMVALREARNKRTVSTDTLVTTAGYLLGVLLIVGYEHGHVMTSKAVNLLMKPTK
jgi:hypothetical protein